MHNYYHNQIVEKLDAGESSVALRLAREYTDYISPSLLGRVLYANQLFELALQQYSNCRCSARILKKRADCLRHLKRWEEALDLYQRSMRGDISDKQLLWACGDCCDELGRSTIARKYYLSAIKYDPFDGQLHFNVGNSFLDEGKHEQAIQFYQKSQSLGFRSSRLLYNLALALEQLDHFAAALRYAQEARSIRRDSTRAIKMMARLYVRLGKKKKLMELQSEIANDGLAINLRRYVKQVKEAIGKGKEMPR